LRISYYVLYSNFEGTVFGKLNNDEIVPYFDGSGNRLYRLFKGTREEGINILRAEYVASLWIFRLIGFLIMWIGLMALFGPVSVLLDIFPIFGTLSRSVIGITTFIVSLLLTIVTILVSMVFHNFIVLVFSILITFGAIIVLFVKLNRNR